MPRKEAGQRNDLELFDPQERTKSQTLPRPDFLTAVGLRKDFWEALPLYLQRATWIGGEVYLKTFVEGKDWDENTAAQALGEAYLDEKRGLIHWEPFLIEEPDPVARFERTLSSPEASEFWQSLLIKAPEVCSEVVKISPRVWVAAKELYHSRGDEHETLRMTTALVSWLHWPHPPAMKHLASPELVIDELSNDPFGVELEEVLAARPEFSSTVAQRTAEFFQGCSPEDWDLLRFLANRSDWEKLPFWQERDEQLLLSKDERVLETIRGMNVSTLERIAGAFNGGWIPPEFLDPQAQFSWPRLPRWARVRFSGTRASTMDWLRQGGKGHFKLPEGRPSDTLIILMSHFLDDKGFDIFRGLGDVRYHLREAITGRRIVPPEEERKKVVVVQEEMGWGEPVEVEETQEPVSSLSDGAREMSVFSWPAGKVLHNLVLGLWSGERKVAPGQLSEIRACVGEIQRLTGDRFSDTVVFSDQDMSTLIDIEDVKPDEEEFLRAKRRRWLLLLEKTAELQKQLSQVLRTEEESAQASVFHILDLEGGYPDSYRKQAVAVRATMAVANEVLSPLIGPEDVFVSEPVVLIQNQEEDWLGFDVPDGLLITGLGGKRLDPEKRAELKALVDNFPEIRAFPLRLGVDFCALVEAIKEEFGVSTIQMDFIEAKSVMGRRLNRSRKQLRQLRKSDLEMVREMTLMTAVAWQTRNGRVDYRDVPGTQVVYLRALGTRAVGFKMHPHDFHCLGLDQENSVRLGDEDRALVVGAVESLRRQIEELEIMAEERRKSGLVLVMTGEPLSAVPMKPFADLEDEGEFGPPPFSVPKVEKEMKEKGGEEIIERPPLEQASLLVDLVKVGTGAVVAGEAVISGEKVRA